MSLARRVAWNTLAQTLARSLALVLAIVVTALLTRQLGVSIYGDYITITVYISFFALFFDWGISTMLARELAAGGASSRLVATALGLRLALCLPVMLLAAGIGFLVYRSDADHAVRYGILIALPAILLTAVSSTLGAVFQAQLKLDRVAAAEALSQVVLAGTIIALVLANRTLYEVLAATVAGSAINTGILVFLSRGLVPIRPQVDPAGWRTLFVRALPLGLGLMVATIYFRADALMLSVLKSSADVGIYGVAYRFLEAITAFPGFFYASIFPVVAALARRRELAELRAVAQRSFDLLILGALPIVLGTLVLAPEIVRALTGNEFLKSVTPLRLVIVGGGLMFVNGLLAYILVALDRQVSVLWLATAALAFNVGLNLILIPKYSYTGAAAVATASEALCLMGSLWLVRRFASFTPSLRVALKGAVAGTAMTVAIVLVDLPLAFAVLLGGAIYVGLLLLMRTHESLELRQLLKAGGA
ncbi:MAG: oligosaccharide flippase family protein [Actinomycetota bacterium]|nr:oligosaccharide flippase family protein [Actinomycetota bacterium]MDQ2980757.1 oligosaccharide flippase family protein [Actinomycetota bacterium]